MIRIATTGWSVPRAVVDAFPAQGGGLERYAARFDAVEINTTFYRSHRPSTYARWAAATPAQFRFAVKLPRTITHHARLLAADPLLAAFRAEALELGDKLGPLLVQLPPSLAFAAPVADQFFGTLRDLWPEAIVCEPRHISWFETGADALLCSHRIGRVAADPACCPAAATPGGWRGLAYWRLHGSPRRYFSTYEDEALCALASDIAAVGAPETWCVFDNTAFGFAAANALNLQAILSACVPGQPNRAACAM